MIRTLSKADAPAVAWLHLQRLRTTLRGRLAQRLLTVYYAHISKGEGGVGYVAVSEAGDLMGYVCGIWDPGHLKKSFIRSAWMRLLPLGILYVLSRPSVLSDMRRRLVSRTPGPGSSNGTSLGYELRPIVVSEACQGQGIAPRLVARLLEDARDRQFAAVFLRTETDNDRANRFYRKLGFEMEQCVDGYNLYRIGLK